jgi:16S rRNA (adenine1518-N6/adenine1519-N6)-dimethyltransferase
VPFYGKQALKTILGELGVRLDKNRGQCYLIDQNMVQFILQQAELDPTQDRVLEIGPGLGSLSDGLAEKSMQLFLIENDHKIGDFLIKNFQKTIPNDQLEIQSNPFESTTKKICMTIGDALTIQFPNVNKIVANIPYQISAPILFKIIDTWRYERVVLMVQKEFADNLIASPNSEKYSRLSAAIGLFLQVKIIKHVSKSCFYPVPKVDSVIVRITAKPGLGSNSPENRYKNEYLTFLKGIFPYKNKNLRKAIGFYLDTISKENNQWILAPLLIADEFLSTIRVRNLSPDQLFTIMLFILGKSPLALADLRGKISQKN